MAINDVPCPMVGHTAGISTIGTYDMKDRDGKYIVPRTAIVSRRCDCGIPWTVYMVVNTGEVVQVYSDTHDWSPEGWKPKG